jgi:putative serine protease PepD
VPARIGACRCGFSTDDPSVLAGAQAVAAIRPSSSVIAAAALALAAAVAAFLLWPGRAVHPPAAASAPAAVLPVVPMAGSAEPSDAAVQPAVSEGSTSDDVVSGAPAPQLPTIAAPAPPAADATGSLSLEDLVARVSPAVVLIETPHGRGTGFFVRADTILTNAHVTGSDLSVRVRRSSGDPLTARVDTIAQDLDLAVVKVPTPLAGQMTLPLGSATRIRIGEEVMAIGSALGVLQNTVTRGIVSGVRQAGAITLVQTDAAINPGNSGGPLVDRRGDVIGITTMGMASAQGISFAVAVDHARELLSGRHTSTTSSTPLSSLNEALTGRAAPSDTDVQREQATRAYDQAVAQLARQADGLDRFWRNFRSSCYEGAIAGSFDREWFALWEPRAMQGAVSPGCGGTFADLKQQAGAVRQAIESLDEAAREAGVYPGTRRDVLRKYRLDYAGWER